jgi:hypothetical protein
MPLPRTATRPLIAGLLVALLAGCGWNTRQPPTTTADESRPAAAPQTEILMRTDLTTGKVVFYGPPVLRPEAPDIARYGHRLRTEIDKASGRTVHWVDLRVHWSGSGIDYWVSATARPTDADPREGGDSLSHERSNASLENRPDHPYQPPTAEAAPVALKLGIAQLGVGTCARVLWVGCDHDEEISAILPEDLLRQPGKHGVRVTFAMKHGRSYVATLTPEQIAVQLMRIDNWKREMQP